jgi:hypothetical protein
MTSRPFAFAAAVAAALAAAVCRAAPTGNEAILTLLNSRAAGSPLAYAAAARTVADAASAGGVLQRYLVAVVSRDADAPQVLRLPKAVRDAYLEESRPKLRLLAEKKNNPLAWYLLSMEDNDMGLLRKAADLGNVQAMNALGTYMLANVLENPTTKSADEAVMKECFELFRRAAAEGDANGRNSYGICLQDGFGCKRDYSEAFNQFTLAAKANHPEAINNLGRFHREGRVVPQDYAAALKCFEKSASLGCVWGQLNYASALLLGEGAEPNPRRAVDLLESIARKGNPDAMEILVKCYGEGLGGIRVNAHAAAVWKVRARAARGDTNAAAWLEANGEKLL